VLHRLLLGERRVGLSELRLENADLLLSGSYNRNVMLLHGVFFANVGLRLLGPLHRAITVFSQYGVALIILLRIDERRLIRGDLLAVLFDDEPLLGDLLIERLNARLRRRDVGASLVKRSVVIAWIDARNHLPGLDRLVVVDRHFGDIARHFGADQDRVRLYVSVIGRDQKAADRPVVVAVTCGRRDKQQRPAGDQQLL